MIQKDISALVKELTDDELNQAVDEANNYDDDGFLDENDTSFVYRLCKERFKSTYGRYLDITVNHIFKEAANRFRKK